MQVLISVPHRLDPVPYMRSIGHRQVGLIAVIFTAAEPQRDVLVDGDAFRNPIQFLVASWHLVFCPLLEDNPPRRWIFVSGLALAAGH